MNIAPYPNYQSTGVEWLGDVPSDWTVKRLKWSVEGCLNGVWGDEPDGIDDVVCLRVADFNRDSYTIATGSLTLRAIEPKQLESRRLKRGDLLIEKSGGGEKQLVGCVVYFDHEFEAVCSNFVARMPVATDHSPRYWAYVHAGLYAGNLNYPAIKQTTGIQNLDAALYLDTLAAYPPLAEQQKIAAFLDWKTSQIDALIAKKQELLRKLKEKRLAVITQAVTKGLNPDAPMRDSGIAWLDEVPAHWEVVPLGFLISISGGVTPSMANAEYWDGDVPWVTPKDMKIPRISNSADHITELALSETAISLIPENAILVVVRGMILAHSFPTAVTEGPVTINQDMKALRCGGRLETEFLYWCLSGFAKVISNFAQESAHGTRKIETETLKKFLIPVPSLNEQSGIVNEVTASLNQLDKLAESSTQTITHLTEYRSALITAATTGKIDLRHVKIPASH